MCGITGIFLFNKDFHRRLTLIEEMTDVLHHRGPDDKGYFANERIALGHRRLSIIDLSAASQQPMHSPDNSLVLVFNGEIYNYAELKNSLRHKGHTFKSSGDAEVILHLYQEYKEDCVKYLEGMFAFAIYDRKRETLFLARDRIGEKPLYYFSDSDGFYFASEIKSLNRLDNFNAKISSPALHAFFSYIQIPSSCSIFQEVKKLQPAHWLKITADGSHKSQPYWHVDCTKKIKNSLVEAKEQLDVLMQDSIKKMLTSDVPIGILLSGGVDSSLILSMALAAGCTQIKAFTVGNTKEASEDKEYLRAKKIAADYGVEHHIYDFSEPEFSEVINAAKKCDEPLALIEIFYCFEIFGKIKDHAKVILTGNGADELFAGYTSYAKIRKLSDFTRPFQFWIERNNDLITGISARVNNLTKARILKKMLAPPLIGTHSMNSSKCLLKEAMQLVSYNNILDAKLFMDLFVLCNHSMSSVPDVGGMAYSVEVRSPFLHHKVIEFAASLPSEYKVGDKENVLYNKFLLKELACDYMKREDIYVSKYGYGYFINSYSLMKNKWRYEIEQTILDPLIAESGLFKMQGIITMWHKFLNDLLSLKEKLLFSRFVIFCIWYKYKFNVVK